MKRIEAKDGLKYITTYEARAMLPPQTDLSNLSKYKVKGSRKTYYLLDDIAALQALCKKEAGETANDHIQNNDEALPCAQIKNEPLSVVAYVDGSFNKNTGVYGSAAIIVSDDKIVVSQTDRGTRMKEMRNVAGEISAAALAVKLAEQLMPDILIIRYDYEGIGKWATREWKAKNKFTQMYADFMNRKRPFDIKYEHVKAHSGDKYNEMADDMAIEAAGIKTMAHTCEVFVGERSQIDEETRRIKYQVCMSCMRDIEEFYKTQKHAFKDYATLKCHIPDNLSSIRNLREFEKILTNDEMLYISRQLMEKNDILDAMRWTARGLYAEDGVRKALVDKEIYSRKAVSN